MESVIGPAEVCRRFGISRSTLFRWEADGLIPTPDRNLRGERRYMQQHCEAIARLIQSRQHRQWFAQILTERPENARSRLQYLGEQTALFKLINLRDFTGLAELREYSPLHSSTIRQLIKFAAEVYDPGQEEFWQVMDVVYTTSSRQHGRASVPAGNA